MAQLQGLQGLTAAAAVAASLALPAAAQPFGAGLMDLSTTDPVEGGPMPGVAVYPSATTGAPMPRGPYSISAQMAAPPMAGPWPLIVVSHGTGGSELGHHDSLVALARAGFIAAALQHPRDNYRDDSGFGTDLQTIGRPHHVVAFLDALLAHPRLGPLIDRERIGIAGFSAGGYTALVVSGARPNFALHAEYALAVTDDPLSVRARAAGMHRRVPGLEIVADRRVRAAFLMAPALGFLFDAAGLADVRIPLRLYRASADEVNRHPWNEERIRQNLPLPPEYVVVEGAGHFAFLAPCSAALANAVPAICRDPPGFDRVAFHEQLNAEMIAFFRRALDLP